MTPSKVVTLGEVARAAGVSLATASRALNGRTRRVNADLAQQVVDAADRFGYVPNVHAQAVARGSSSVVGLVVPDIDDPYFSAIATGVMRRRAGRTGVSLGATLRNAERELTYLGMLRAQRARAIILVGSRSSDHSLTDRLAREIAVFEAPAGGWPACPSHDSDGHRYAGEPPVQPRTRAGARGSGPHPFAVLSGPRRS